MIGSEGSSVPTTLLLHQHDSVKDVWTQTCSCKSVTFTHGHPARRCTELRLSLFIDPYINVTVTADSTGWTTRPVRECNPLGDGGVDRM